MRFNRGVKKEKKAIVNPFEGDEEVDYQIQRAKSMMPGHLLKIDRYEGLFVETGSGRIVTMA